MLMYVLVPFQKGKSIKFWSFNPSSFRNIRLTYGISDAEYINLFGATTKVRIPCWTHKNASNLIGTVFLNRNDSAKAEVALSCSSHPTNA